MAGTSSTNFHTEFRVVQASKWHRGTAKAMGAVMWFWMMYRAKQDMPYLLTKHKPWNERAHAH
ncbi:hypothetical protein H9P43_006783 [Blastocladiella emersonii ATCC 22665]|nr:hypothetical protein H9P43_006783 [Blastocladiella emersonii ATCC 22665]